MILLQQQQQPLSAAETQPLHPSLLQQPLSFLVQCSSGSNHSVPQHIKSSYHRFSHRSNSGSFHCRRIFAHPTIAQRLLSFIHRSSSHCNIQRRSITAYPTKTSATSYPTTAPTKPPSLYFHRSSSGLNIQIRSDSAHPHHYCIR